MNTFTESIRIHRYNLRTCGPLEFVNPSTASGEKCLRCYLHNFINDSSPWVLDKINTLSTHEGYSFFIKITKLNIYRMECTVPNCSMCSNCPRIYPVLIWKCCFVLCNVFHGYPVQALRLWFDYLYQILHITEILSVSFFFSLLCFFRIYFLLPKFTNYVIYALLGVQDPDTIIICCMYSSECKHVQTTKILLEILTFVSAIECRFCFIIHRSSKFQVSF